MENKWHNKGRVKKRIRGKSNEGLCDHRMSSKREERRRIMKDKVKAVI